MLEWLRGKFIVFDGPDGSGKSTQLQLLHGYLQRAGVPVTVAKDPGGTEIGNRIRHVLLDFDLSDMDARCEALLFMASRAQLVTEVVAPALARGETVLCDRFISATCAYQVAAGLDVQTVISLGRHAVGDTWPALTIILDLPPEVGFERTGRRPAAERRTHELAGQRTIFPDARTDAMESRSLEFHQRVRTLFRELERVYPRPVAHVDAVGDSGAVHERVLRVLDHASARG